MSNDQFNSKDPSADVMADAVAFAPDALYASKFEYYRDMRNPRYKSDPIYRLQADDKAVRSFAGKKIPNVRDYDHDPSHRMAGAVLNKDGTGTIDAGVLSLDAPNGRRQPDGNDEGGAPLITHRPGGGMQANVSRSDLPKLPVDESRKAYEAEQERQRRKNAPRIEPLPVKK